MLNFDVTKLLSRLAHPYTRTEILEYGKIRRDFHMMGARITVRRKGRSGVTTGPFQSCFYVCNETEKKVICGPLSRLGYADLIINHLMMHMSLELTDE